jgi:hypothetical protein
LTGGEATRKLRTAPKQIVRLCEDDDILVALSPNGVDEYRLPSEPDELLVATKGGVIRLCRAGDRWREAERSLGGLHVSCLLTGLDGGVSYAGSHGDGVFRYSNATGWVECSAGLESRNVYSLSYRNVGNRAEIYAGTEPAYVYRRFDDAREWTEVTSLRTIPGRDAWTFPPPPHVAHAKHVDFDPRDNRHYFVSIEQGALLKTEDDGVSFRQLFFEDGSYIYGNDVHRVVINPLNPDELYLSGGDGITRSQDGGATWRHVATPTMRVAYPDATFCSPFEDGVLFTAGAGGRPGLWRKSGNADATIVRSDDHGNTWTAVDLPALRGNIEAMTLVSWPRNFGFFAGTTDGDVFASFDSGVTWSNIASGLPPLSKGVHSDNVLIGRGAA